MNNIIRYAVIVIFDHHMRVNTIILYCNCSEKSGNACDKPLQPHIQTHSRVCVCVYYPLPHLLSTEAVLRDISWRKEVPALLRSRANSARSLANSSGFLTKTRTFAPTTCL
jgi:hypothetical protein